MIFADDIVLVAKYPEELESMLANIHLASISEGLSMNLSKTKWNENATTSTVTVDGNTIEKVDRYVYLGKTMTQAGGLLPEIKRRIALGWAAFSKVASIMMNMKDTMNVKRKVHNEYVLPVMGPWGPQFCGALCYGETQRLPAGGAGSPPVGSEAGPRTQTHFGNNIGPIENWLKIKYLGRCLHP